MMGKGLALGITGSNSLHWMPALGYVCIGLVAAGITWRQLRCLKALGADALDDILDGQFREAVLVELFGQLLVHGLLLLILLILTSLAFQFGYGPSHQSGGEEDGQSDDCS